MIGMITATPDGAKLYVTFRDENGKWYRMIENNFRPYFFVPKSNKMKPFAKLDEVEKIDCNTPGEVPDKAKQIADERGISFVYEADIKYDARYFVDNSEKIKDVPVSVSWIDIEVSMTRDDKKRATFDEIKDGKCPIICITRLDTLHKKIWHYTTCKIDEELIYKSFKSEELTKLNEDSEDAAEKKKRLVEEIKDFELIIKQCVDEIEMLEEFLDDLHQYKTDVMTGWNFHFDFQVIYKRCLKWGIVDRLCYFPNVVPRIKEREIKDSDGKTIGIAYDYWTPGYYVIDYLEVYKKRNLKDERSYALDYITRKWNVVLPKVQHSFGTDFDRFAKEAPDLLSYYNIADVISLYLVDKSSGYMDISIALCREAKCPLIYCTTNRMIVDCFILTELKKRGMVRITPLQKETQRFSGAFVFAEKGFHKCYFADLDFSSLYPSIMISLNVSPETYVSSDDAIDDSQVIKSPVGHKYRKNIKGLIPELLEKLFAERKADKKKALEYKKKFDETGDHELFKLFRLYWNRQNAKKTILNSFYGVLGDPKYSLYKKEVAETVTGTGQFLIKYAKSKVEEYGYKVLYVDTDSLYIKLKDHNHRDFDLSKELDDIVECVKRMQDVYKFVNSQFDELKEMWNLDKHIFEMKSEILGRNIFIVEKKMYAFCELLDESVMGDVLNMESEEEIRKLIMERDVKPSGIKIKGLPTIKSQMPEYVANLVNKILQDLLHGKIDEKMFVVVMESLWQKKIVPAAKQDPRLIALTVKKNKVPAVADIVWKAICKYNEKNPTRKIELGEKVYFIKTLTPEKGVVWKFDDPVPNVPIDFNAMYESLYKNIKEQLVSRVKL